MKRLLTLLAAAVAALNLYAYEPAVKDIDIQVSLSEDGTAHIVERWDVVVASGTEWYLVRNNLGDIKILHLAVTNEEGLEYVNEGSWNVDRSIERKAGKCGLNSTGSGYEICWGVGSYGPHVFTVSYDMTNAVKTLNDFDMLHMQFVSDGLSSPPDHVHLTLSAPVALDKENSRIWAFGYDGTVWWNEGGSVEAESGEAFDDYSSLILLLRFNKGIFNSGSTQDRDFQEVLDKAQEGSYYPDEGPDPWYVTLLGAILAGVIFYYFFIWPVKKVLQFIGIVKKKDRKRIKDIFGVRTLPGCPVWSRDIPFKGNFLETYYIASHMKGLDDGKYTIVSAIILRMINAGVITMRLDEKGKKEFTFNSEASTDYMQPTERIFLTMVKNAAGKDGVLQENEFSSWSKNHRTDVRSWVSGMETAVTDSFRGDGLTASVGYLSYSSLKLNERGHGYAMEALGFRQFLDDFTLVSERSSTEVSLWGDYLVVASLFGIADKVAKEMQRIAPDVTIGKSAVPVSSFGDVVVLSNTFRSYARDAATYSYYSGGSSSSYSGSSSSSRGYGGYSSRGGGGGYSGGGRGGGSR